MAAMTPYRRHTKTCDHRAKGAHYSLCDCPIWVYGQLPDGRPIRQSLQTTDWTRAERRIENFDPATDPAAALTLHQALDAYTRDLKARALAPATLQIYDTLFDHLRNAVPSTTPLTAIDAAVLEQFRAARRRIAHDESEHPLKPSTQQKEIGYLRAFFSWCLTHRYIEQNPAKLLRMPRVEPLTTKPYEAHEVQALISACDLLASSNPAETPYIRRRARAIVLTLLYSGLRISDLCKLRREALDPTTGYLFLRRTQKTGVPVRVKLPPDAVEALNRIRAVHPDYYFWRGSGAWSTLRNSVTLTIARLGKIAGVAARPHRFRDTFAVALLTGGASLRTVQQLLGHESIQVTERHYAHFVADHQRLLDQATANIDFGAPRRPVLLQPRKIGRH